MRLSARRAKPDVPSRPKLLLFDLDGVLADYQRPIRCRHLAQALAVTEAEVDLALFGRGLEERSDRGDLDLADYLDTLRVQYGWNLPAEDFIAARRAATQVQPGMRAICQRLATQAALGIFTNNGIWFGDHASRIVPELMPLFGRRLVCSGSLGICKPAPEAFLACLQGLGFNAFSTLFIDNNADNVEGARQAGLDALHFQALPSFTAALRERDLDPGVDDAS